MPGRPAMGEVVMKKTMLTLILAFLPFETWAQVSLVLALEKEHLLRYEPIYVAITVHNNSAHPLTIGASNDMARLRFDIVRIPGYTVPERRTRRLPEPLTLAPGETRRITRNLAPRYSLHEGGTHRIRAILETEDDLIFSDNKALFRVEPGLELASKTVTLNGEPPLKRTYTLRYLAKTSWQTLYLCIEDKQHKLSYGVITLGNLLLLRPPCFQSDLYGNAHVLHQSAPEHYTYTIVSPGGRVRHSEIYLAGPSGIALRKALDGGVDVVGGIPYMPPKRRQEAQPAVPETR